MYRVLLIMPHIHHVHFIRRLTLSPFLSHVEARQQPEILTDSFNGEEREFQYLGAMFFIDLLSEWLTKKLLLAPLVE